MDPLNFLPLALTCAISLGAWVVALLLDRRLASSPEGRSDDDPAQPAWFLE